MKSPLDIFDNLNDNFRVILEKTFTVQLSKKNKNKKGSTQVNRKVDKKGHNTGKKRKGNKKGSTQVKKRGGKKGSTQVRKSHLGRAVCGPTGVGGRGVAWTAKPGRIRLFYCLIFSSLRFESSI